LVGERLVTEDARGGFLLRRLESDQLSSYYELRVLLFSLALKRVRRAGRSAALLGCGSATDIVKMCLDDVVGEQWACLQRILLPYARAEITFAGSLSLPALHAVNCERQLALWMNGHHRRCARHVAAIITHSQNIGPI
jgi:hypothetical protein